MAGKLSATIIGALSMMPLFGQARTAPGYEQVKAHHILIAFASSPAARQERPLLSEEQARVKAEELRIKILAGASFEDLARAESDDTGSASRGGDLGAFGRGTMIPEFEKVAFGAKVGEIPPVVRTPYGYHIVRVDEHTTIPWSESPSTQLRNRLIARVKNDRWQPLQWSIAADGTTGAVFFLDSERGWRNTAPGVYRAWTRWEVYPSRRLEPWVYDSVVEDSEHDCRDFRIRVFAQHLYAPDGSYQSTVEPKPKWSDLIPGSEGEAFHGALCKEVTRPAQAK